MKKLNLNVKTICLMAMFFVAWPACASSPAWPSDPAWPSNPAWPSDPAWPSAPSCQAKAKAKVKARTRTYDSKAVEKMTERFVAYAKINSQGTDTSDMNVFPINAGQREMAQKVEADLQAAVRGTSATVRRSESEYVYVKIPANAKGIPSIMFMAHLDITPEAPGGNITPVVHRAYDGGDLVLPGSLVLSPSSPQGRHLAQCVGKTIITSDGTTLLGADDKTGCAILVTLVERVVRDKNMRHGDLYFVFSQNEDIGRAADRFETSYVDGSPDVVIDIDGDTQTRFSVANFTAAARVYRFSGKEAHPGDAYASKYGDVLTAAAFFIGQLPPAKHPSASRGTQGYIHCYAMTPITTTNGVSFTEVKVRLRYFDKQEGDTLRSLLDGAAAAMRQAYPNVCVEAQPEFMQYENVAYTMAPSLTSVIVESGRECGLALEPQSERGGTTSAMMAAKGLRGGPCLYSGQQAEHSVYEWTCVEDMLQMTDVAETIIRKIASQGNSFHIN